MAGALGVVLFGESLRHNPIVLLGEVLAVAMVIASVIMLSQSPSFKMRILRRLRPLDRRLQ